MRVGTAAEWRAWLWRGVYLWASLVLLVGGAWFALRYPRTESAIRQLGLVYQVVGVFAAAWQIGKTAKEHGVESLWAKTVKYLRGVPLLRGQDKTVALQGVGASGSAGTLFGVGWGTNSTDTTERKVEWLLEIVRNHEDRIIAVDRRVETVDRDLRSELARERAQREALRVALDEQVKKAATGTLDLALFGLFYILLGTLLSTATPELCKWLLPACRLGV